MRRTTRTLGAAALLAMPIQPALAAGEDLDCLMRPKATIEVGSPDEGIMDEVLVERGDLVRKGDVVARLDMRLEQLAVELAALRAAGDVDIRSAHEQLAYRDRELARVSELREREMASQRDYDQLEIERRLAELQIERAELEHEVARVEHERSRAMLARRMINSPVDGVVVEVTMSPGEYAYEQAPVMTIAEIDPLHVEAYVPIERYGTIAVGMTGEVRPEEPIGGRHVAEVTVVDLVFDAASGTFGVRLSLPNPDYELPAGVRCRVRFSGGSDPSGDGEG